MVNSALRTSYRLSSAVPYWLHVCNDENLTSRILILLSRSCIAFYDSWNFFSWYLPEPSWKITEFMSMESKIYYHWYFTTVTFLRQALILSIKITYPILMTSSTNKDGLKWLFWCLKTIILQSVEVLNFSSWWLDY